LNSLKDKGAADSEATLCVEGMVRQYNQPDVTSDRAFNIAQVDVTAAKRNCRK
jgi:hypothetical protein